MSRRMQRNRYPKGSSADTIAGPPNTQFPPLIPVSQPANTMLYNPSSQPNAWTQPLYPNASAEPPNHTNQPVAEMQNFWSPGQVYPSPNQASWSNTQPEFSNSTEFSYQQPTISQTSEQWQQQVPYSQPSNPIYHQPQSTGYEYVQTYSPYEYPLDSSATDLNNSTWNQPETTNVIPTYENGGLYVSDNQQPWQVQDTVPFTDPAQNCAEGQPQNETWPYNASNAVNSEYNVHDTSSTNYLCVQPEGVEENQYLGSVDKPSPQRGKDDPGDNVITNNSVEENQAGALSAFFQDSDQSESTDVDIGVPSSEPLEGVAETLPSQREDNILPLDVENTVSDIGLNSEANAGSFIQEEKSAWENDVDVQDWKCAGVEAEEAEPINQEVIDPHTDRSLDLPMNSEKVSVESVTEDPPNQEIPVSSGPPSRSTSAERERVVIRPREDSPFKPPRASISKNIVVQQEAPLEIPPESLPEPEDKTVIQEVNLETFPDNLERPPDYEELRKQSPLYASHQRHFSRELNDSPSSLLCENLDIPSVTLAPAAPPISSAKSDKSESSTSSKIESASVGSSNLSLSRLNESNPIGSLGDAETCNKANNSGNQQSSFNAQASALKVDDSSSNSPSEDCFKTEKGIHQNSYLKDSKMNGRDQSNRNSEERLNLVQSSLTKSADARIDKPPSTEIQTYDSNREIDFKHDRSRDQDQRPSNIDPRYNRSRERDPMYDRTPEKYFHNEHQLTSRDPRYDERSDRNDPRFVTQLEKKDSRYYEMSNVRDPRYGSDLDRNKHYDPSKDPRYDRSSNRDPRYDDQYGSRHEGRSERDPRYDNRSRNKDPRYEINRSDFHDPRYEERTENRDPRYDDRSDRSHQRFSEQKFQNYDERQYYSDRERSRPSSRTSLQDFSGEYSQPARTSDYPYASSQGDPREGRRHSIEYRRPSSRSSETELSQNERHKQQGYYRNQYPQKSQYPHYRETDYYNQKSPNNRNYEYDQYHRDPYASYYDAYRYAYSNYNYGFYDELYRNDPRYKQYQEQYRLYYEKYQQEEYERSSAHSGRSSVNENSKGDHTNQFSEQDIDSNASEMSAYNLGQSYQNEDSYNMSNTDPDISSTPSTRLTPAKFSYAHSIARFSPGGLLITIVPDPLSTVTTAPIRIHNLQEIRANEESFSELKNHQGPLIRGSTHKNDIIEFCSQKIKNVQSQEDVVDRDSVVLLWELMVLLLRQNGSVAGSDISELLLKDHEVLRPSPVSLKLDIETPLGPQSPAESSQSHAGDISSPDEGIVVTSDKTVLNTVNAIDVDNTTRKFREFLMFGHKKDALEWAMKNGLWGHALFLASKMETRTYANVMTRFANSLALNDPLQTLYQLMSGRQPLAVTNVADTKWGDWRPHLAMILSNPSVHPEVDSRSITTLGDTLANKGCLCAAHFCYIMAQVEFGTYEQRKSKLVLLNSDHTHSFEEFATNEAIQLTEIYEYAQSLANPGFMLVHLQFYKFLYSMRLIEHGFLEEALHYTEIISEKLRQHYQLFSFDFICEVYALATKLKYHDPHFLRGQGEYEDQDDPDWLKELTNLVQNYNNYAPSCEMQQCNELSEGNQNNVPTQPIENISNQSVPTSSLQQDANSYQTNYYQPGAYNQQNNFQNSTYSPNGHVENVGYYQSDVSSKRGSFQRDNSIPSHEENDTTDVPSSPVTQTPPFDYYSSGSQPGYDSKPLYDGNNSYGNVSSARERRDSAMSSGSRYSSGSTSVVNKSLIKESPKLDVKKEKASTQAGKTWLGGIFSRLLPRGPNQMILPDDKNPTIVWDDQKKCWVNKDSNEDEDTNGPVAPPTDMELMGSTKSSSGMFQPPVGIQPQHVGAVHEAPPASSGPLSSMPPTSLSQPPINKFQRPKTRGMRQNYVDVLNTSGATTKPNVLPDTLFATTLEPVSSPKMFIPGASSVGEEIPEEYELQQFDGHVQPNPEVQPEVQGMPQMYDPSQLEMRKANISQQRSTLSRPGRRQYPT